VTEPLALAIPEAARISGIGRSKIYEEVNKGHLRLVKIGRRSVILMDDLRAWLASKAKEAA
jgi:excisionase family DNA binding protein